MMSIYNITNTKLLKHEALIRFLFFVMFLGSSFACYSSWIEVGQTWHKLHVDILQQSTRTIIRKEELGVPIQTLCAMFMTFAPALFFFLSIIARSPKVDPEGITMRVGRKATKYKWEDVSWFVTARRNRVECVSSTILHPEKYGPGKLSTLNVTSSSSGVQIYVSLLNACRAEALGETPPQPPEQELYR